MSERFPGVAAVAGPDGAARTRIRESQEGSRAPESRTAQGSGEEVP